MFRSSLLRGASAGALTLSLLSATALAQEALPTIDIGAARPAPTGNRAGATEDPKTYHPDTASTALKTNTPIMVTPASVQVVPRQVMEDQQAITLDRVLDNVSGVRSYSTTFNARGGDSLQIRGFNTSNVYVDGLRSLNSDIGSGSLDILGVERVEVLKGPASILYGRADPGGIVNIVTALPKKTPSYAVQQMFGSWNLYRTTVEATGPLTADGAISYRVSGLVEDSRSFRDFDHARNYVVMPVVRWDIDAATQITANFQYKRQSSPFDVGTGAFTKYDVLMGNPLALLHGVGPLAFLPPGRNFGEPNSTTLTERVMFGFNWSHKFDENWTLTQRFQANLNQTLERWVVPYAFDFFDPTQVDRFAIYNDRHQRTYAANMDLTGKVDTFGLEHSLLIGGDFLSVLSATPTTYLSFNIPNLNYFAPVYGFTPTDKTLYDPINYGPSANRQHWYGFYAQDHIKLRYDLYLLAGVRYDHANVYQTGYDGRGDTVVDNSQKVTPRFGLLWRPLPEFSVYGSYLTNFGPGASGGPGRALPPQAAEQWEVGVKTELLDGRFSATLAYYNLIKTNVPAPDPDPALAAQGYSVALGETRNRGVELDVAGEIRPGWRMIGSYAYIDSLITKDSASQVFDPLGNLISASGFQGFATPGVSRHMGSLWSTYEMQQGDLRGLKFGGGVTSRSSSHVDLFDSFQVRGYATVGLMASYEWTVGPTKVTAQLNVENLLDTRYYPSGTSALGVEVGAPRGFRGSIRMAF